MSKPTLVFIRARYVDGHLTHYPGEEVPPDLFSQEVVDQSLDQGWLREVDAAVRPSLYCVFHRFTGSKERESLTPQQLANYTLEE